MVFYVIFCDWQELQLREGGVPVPEGFKGGRKSYTLAAADYCGASEINGQKLAGIGVL